MDCPGFLGGRDLWEVEAHGITEAHPAELRERAVKRVFELRAETRNARGSIARVG